MLEKINNLRNWQVALIMVIVGFAVFSTGLNGGFQGDDTRQIVENVPVHSISNLVTFFQGGTFYTGVTPNKLEGGFYRPLMSTAFSIIYSIFGAKPFYFHFIQLLLHIAAAFLLYVFLKNPFSRSLALFLSLLFLVHPVNSQSVFAIPSIQDPLFLLFGISGLILLFNYDSRRSLIGASVFFLLSLLTKETGLIFIVVAIALLYLWKKEKLAIFVKFMVPVFIIYSVLRLTAVGFLNASNSAPIGRVGLAERLMTAPSAFVFYFEKLIFPWKMSSSYYWVEESFSFTRVLLPLIVSLAIISIFVFTALKIKKKDSGAFKIYTFFSLWLILGMLLVMQFFPLDMTASETWLYLPMVGVLGMLGVTLTVFHNKKFKTEYVLALGLVVLIGFGVRSFTRGFDWKTEYSIALKDTMNSTDNHRANSIVASTLINQSKFKESKPFAEEALKVYPNYNNYFNLAVISASLGEYKKAIQLFENSIPWAAPTTAQQSSREVSKVAMLGLSYADAEAYIKNELTKYPEDPSIWTTLAILEAKNGNRIEATKAIEAAAKYSKVDPVIYDTITKSKPLNINIYGKRVQLYQ